MMIRFTYVFAALTLAIGPLSEVRAQSSPDYQPFDPARIGLPALTEELDRSDARVEGYREEIDRMMDKIEKARKRIADLQAEAEERAKAEAEFEKYKETIHHKVEEIDRLADEHLVAAAEKTEAGRVADVGPLRNDLTIVLKASRFNALLGNEKKALKQWKAVVKRFKTFSSSFSQTCYDQSFDPAFALGLERQNEMLGTGIDVTPCAKRRYTFRYSDGVWQNCSIGGQGEWVFKVGPAQQIWGMTIAISGSGSGTVDAGGNGSCTFKTTTERSIPSMPYSDSVSYEEHLDMKLIVYEHAREDGTSPREMHANIRSKGPTIATATRVQGRSYSDGPRVSPYQTEDRPSIPVAISDKPCKSPDD